MSLDAPLILGIESSTGTGSVALVRGDECRGFAELTNNQQSETLLSTITQLLDEAAAGIDDLAAIAISIGPGSFTGLRIGLATAKGLATGAAIDLVDVSSLTALAMNVAAKGDCCAVIDAGRGDLYAERFCADQGSWRSVGGPWVVSPQALIERIISEGKIVQLVGGHAEKLVAAGTDANLVVAEAAPVPTARHVARAGLARWQMGFSADVAALAPNYIGVWQPQG